MSASNETANNDPSKGGVNAALASFVPASLSESIHDLESWMLYFEVAIFLFGIPLTAGCIAEIWDWSALPRWDLFWRACVAVGVAGETILAMAHSCFSARHRMLTNRKDSEQSALIAAAHERAEEATKKLAPRMLKSPKAAESLVGRLSTFPGQLVHCVVADRSGSPESRFLAEQMWEICANANWEARLVAGPDAPSVPPLPYAGVLIEIALGANPKVKEAAETLKLGLLENGIAAGVRDWARTRSDCGPLRPELIRVCVYRKY